MFSGLSRSLGARLLVAVLAISALILAAVGLTSYLTTRNTLIAQARDQAQALADHSALAIDGQFAPLYAIPGAVAANEQRTVNGATRLEQLRETLPAQLERLPSVQGIYMTFAKDALGDREYAEVWYTRDDDTIAPFYSNLPGNPGYDPSQEVYAYETEDWYTQPVQAGGTIWTEPYVDSESGIGVVSATTPVTVDGKLLGVTGVDVSLEAIQQLVAKTQPTTNSYAMVVGQTGTFIANPRFPDSVLTQTIGEFAAAQNNDAIAQLGKVMTAGETGIIELRDPATGQLAWAAYQPVQTTGWSTAVIIPQRDLLGGLEQLRTRALVISSLGLALLAFLLFLLARSITQPLRQLTTAAQGMAAGNFASRVPLVRQDEIGTLAHSFNSMAQSLHERIDQQQRINEELRAANDTKVAKDYLEKIVNSYSAFANRVAHGDLTARLDIGQGQDELTHLGRNLNTMVVSLHHITGQVQQAGANIASAASEILASTSQQAASATEQSAAITQTTTTVEEVKAIAQQTAQQATQLVSQSHHVLEVAHQGTDAVEQTVDGMGLIRERVDSIAHTILALSEQTAAIGEITQTVTDLADQSNLLALNAAIEAARAGEHGKGFAVVAQHVRELAERSKSATAQVRQILNEIQRATSTAVMVTEEGTKGVTQGAELAGKAGQVITRMAREVETGTQANMQVAAAAQQQTAGMDQIGQAMGAIQQATTETLSSTRQAERAAKDLTSLAQSLQQAVAAYRV